MRYLISSFKKARKEFIDAVNRVPKDKTVTGSWRTKEILAHMTGWTDFQIKIIQQFKKNLKADRTPKIQEYNKNSVNKRKNWSWDKVYQEFLQAGEKLISEYVNLPERLWKKPFWPDKKTTPERFIQIEIEHYQQEHLQDLKKIIKS